MVLKNFIFLLTFIQDAEHHTINRKVLKKLSKEDAALVEDIKADEKRQSYAMKILDKKYRKMVENHACNNNGSEQDGEDLAQKVFTELILNIQQDKFKGDASIKNYLMGMCKNMWLKELEKRKRQKKLLESMPEPEEEKELDHDKLIGAVAKLLEQVTESCQKFVQLYYFQKKKMAEVAEQMGLANANTAKNKNFRCIDSIRQWLRDNPGFRDYLDDLRS